MNNLILEAKNIYKSFKKATHVVNVLVNMSLQINKGDFTAVVGPSGSGKSTLLHILGGLDKPDSGEVLFEGKNIFSSNGFIDKFRNENVGFIFQFHYLLNDFNALENVMFPALIKDGNKNRAKMSAEYLLEKVGLKDRMNHYPSELSGGEQQRVAIARALINEPHILLADEPTGNLDRANSYSIFEIFKKLNDDGLTILVVTHDSYLAGMTKNKFNLSKD
ncbi:ABC transporter ATP-binding protein [Deferribacterales bacterium Es71-Z0220]|jgi:lipoprotein-releasing system ATP-binding protein|uniref:ABC transporter ATP-binding protein n=1 Tax=Deferrivibrio essentukiensis TaxID=2880922 RepID=UPI001F60993B|nr:ABC transporter ATP-binding protein [Deferrivibrio essentukiensis]MCB4203467.1 ABC transporter ATP-binding protein [Deferrivibrio essentukiensis]MDK2791272.1 lipoprotein-releasing system ATP-binding protein [Deferribacteres bacterium]